MFDLTLGHCRFRVKVQRRARHYGNGQYQRRTHAESDEQKKKEMRHWASPFERTCSHATRPEDGWQ
jgi:hypothetical protein